MIICQIECNKVLGQHIHTLNLELEIAQWTFHNLLFIELLEMMNTFATEGMTTWEVQRTVDTIIVQFVT